MEYPPQTERKENISLIRKIFDFLKGISWFISALTALVIFILVKTFLFDLAKVNNKDMQATYSYGDVLLIKKIFVSYQVNDVLYFEYPIKDSLEDKKTFMFQRLCGLPGDSVALVNKVLFVNGMEVAEDSTIKKNYFVETGHKQLDSVTRAKYGLFEGGEISNDFDYSYSMTKQQNERLKKDSLIRKTELKSEKKDNYDETAFPYSPYYKWNLDFYGKIYVPKKNDTLRLDSNSIHLYASLITQENNTLEIRGDSIFVSGILSKVYVPQQNYFFVLGDNRDNANDSRTWGFLPENCIVGKVLCRLKKNNR